MWIGVTSMESTVNNEQCQSCKKTHIRIIKSQLLCINCYTRNRKKTCKEISCTKKEYCQGYCQGHYKSGLESGKIQRVVKQNICTVEGCSKDSLALNLCSKHYQQFQKGKLSNSKPDDSNNKKNVPLTRKQIQTIKKKAENAVLREKFLTEPIGKVKNDVKYYRFDAYELANIAQIAIGKLSETLEHLKEDEQILEYNYDKKIMSVEIRVTSDVELSFAINLNQKPEYVFT